MTLSKTVAEIRRKLAASTTELQNEVAALRQKIAETRTQLLNAQNAPLPVEEIIAKRIPAVVAEHAAWWLRDRGSQLVGVDRGLGAPNLTGSITLPWSMTEAVSWAMLCASHPKFATEVLANLVRRVEYTPGPSSAERPAIVERLEGELAELETAEERIVDDAAAAGVVIQHRPEVLARRETEARRQKFEEEAVAGRQQREAHINKLHAQQEALNAKRRGGGQSVSSSYLDRERLVRERSGS